MSKRRGKQVNLWMDPHIDHQISVIARAEGRSKSDVYREAVCRHLMAWNGYTQKNGIELPLVAHR